MAKNELSRARKSTYLNHIVGSLYNVQAASWIAYETRHVAGTQGSGDRNFGAELKQGKYGCLEEEFQNLCARPIQSAIVGLSSDKVGSTKTALVLKVGDSNFHQLLRNFVKLGWKVFFFILWEVPFRDFSQEARRANGKNMPVCPVETMLAVVGFSFGRLGAYERVRAGGARMSTMSKRSSMLEANEGKKLIVGLGNPGRQYAGTRHNIGATLVDQLAEIHGINMTKTKFNSYYGSTRRFSAELQNRANSDLQSLL